ncbi:putative AbiEii toxin of type IV toxin-antitoxin system [Tenacibaculum sp. 190130A14a]|uniref:AbiEii toxin of type IV toxin-antitoxin system n=1 Tax=Tenacibaculum polynesiense TaxID=3137857 RepID=A0ABP1F0Y6_9FLAO
MNLKLCYIWVSEFRNFKNTGFNFSSSEKFHYDGYTGKLSMEKIEDLPENFFGDSITDVTALIGKNGSGKSNALELVCKLLKGGETSITEDFLIVTQENNQFIGYHSKKEEWVLEFDFPLNLKKYNKIIDPLKIVYFSNVFDERKNNFDRDISDISYNNRFKRGFYNYNIETDFKKQIRFINSPLFKRLNIQTPTKIQIISKVWRSKYINAGLKRYNYIENTLKKFQELYKTRLKDIKSSKKFYYNVVYAFFEETIKILNTISNENNKNEFYLEEFFRETQLYKGESTQSMTNDMLKWMKYISNSLEKNSINNRERKELSSFKKRLQLLFEIEDKLLRVDFEYKTEGSRNRTQEYFLFDYTPKTKEVVVKYIELFEKSKMFDVNWLGVSSGHKAYLNIFSLIYHELKRIKRPNLLLCIDEGDLYLHPQWQIEFFDKLVSVLPEIFKDNIQIILTSHSPFLLSDLPKQNITIISPNKEIQTLNGNELKTETFAGNIYSLYEEPFFLDKQRISLFAKKKIDEIFEELENKNTLILKDNHEVIKRKIELIGDEVIRFHLMKRLEND